MGLSPKHGKRSGAIVCDRRAIDRLDASDHDLTAFVDQLRDVRERRRWGRRRLVRYAAWRSSARLSSSTFHGSSSSMRLIG